MPTSDETKIYRMACVCAVLGIAAFVVPRFVPNSEGGFASAASAIAVFLLLLAVTFVVALYLLTITLRRYQYLSVSLKVIGIAPGVILGVALIWLFFFLGY